MINVIEDTGVISESAEEHDKEQSDLLRLRLESERDTVALGRLLAQSLPQASVVYLYGDLGAGKTTLVRGMLRSLGHQGVVKSPTYTLVEPYEFESLKVFHFDLYRLADPEELDYIGIREYQDREYQGGESLLIFEWPDKGRGMIPEANLIVQLDYDGQGRCATLMFKEASSLQKIREKLANSA